ncbi:hypothetical protein NQZ68_028221 [Dissostichus eleginoides]|nr:hypothetical protein NQZ68_028221 [Dissostichus eleginoides]
MEECVEKDEGARQQKMAEIAATVTSLWEGGAEQMEREKEWEEAAERVGTNHPYARDYVTVQTEGIPAKPRPAAAALISSTSTDREGVVGDDVACRGFVKVIAELFKSFDSFSCESLSDNDRETVAEPDEKVKSSAGSETEALVSPHSAQTEEHKETSDTYKVQLEARAAATTPSFSSSKCTCPGVLLVLWPDSLP